LLELREPVTYREGVNWPDLGGVPQADIRGDMFSENPGTELDLLAMYNFRSQDISKGHGAKVHLSFAEISNESEFLSTGWAPLEFPPCSSPLILHVRAREFRHALYNLARTFEPT
jgi:hypothetical protein